MLGFNVYTPLTIPAWFMQQLRHLSCANRLAQSLRKFCKNFDVSRPSTMVLFFEGLQFAVDFTSKHFPYKRKREIRRNITENGGTISYILNNKVCQSSEVGDISALFFKL